MKLFDRLARGLGYLMWRWRGSPRWRRVRRRRCPLCRRRLRPAISKHPQAVLLGSCDKCLSAVKRMHER